MLHRELEEIGLATAVLDGDEVRKRLTKGLGFSREDREENIRRIAYVANLLTRVGAVAITAAISPYLEMRQRARTEIGNFVEVYVHCPLQVCMQRDVKGLYAKAVRGEVLNFTGISAPYEPPANPEITIHTECATPKESLRQIIERLVVMNYLPEKTAGCLLKDLRDEHRPVDADAVKPNSHWAI